MVECGPAGHDDDGDSEDEGWYSLSRTDVRKLQEVRSSGERCDVNIILTNPADILQLCSQQTLNEESSPERTSYR